MIYKKLVASTQKQGQTLFLHTKQGQTLFFAHKTGTDLVSTQKTGTDLVFAHKTGTDLVFAHKTGTDLVFTQKQGQTLFFKLYFNMSSQGTLTLKALTRSFSGGVLTPEYKKLLSKLKSSLIKYK